MQNKKKIYLIISIVSFSIVLAALAAIGGLLLAYKRQSDNYEQLAAAARTTAPAAPTTPATEAVEETQPVETEPPLPTVEIPINFDYLKGENEDIIGWIVVDGTLIDYPILYDTTYNYYYLNHNYEGTSTGYGSIFVLGRTPGTLRTSTPWSTAITCWTGGCLPSCTGSGIRISSIPTGRSSSTPRSGS